jgi:hypothetical protein
MASEYRLANNINGIPELVHGYNGLLAELANINYPDILYRPFL